MTDDTIPTPSVRRVDPRREAIRTYERLFEEHDARYAQLVGKTGDEIASVLGRTVVDLLIDEHAVARAILASAICAERGVSRW